MRIAFFTALLLACSPAGTESGPKLISASQVLAGIRAGEPRLILDVRTPKEYEVGHVPGAINIPHDEVLARLGEIRDALRERNADGVIVYCARGGRARAAREGLLAGGIENVASMSGHMRGWLESGLPVERPVSGTFDTVTSADIEP